MNRRAGKNLIVAIYYHPEAYPPTLNAIDELSEEFSNITIVHQPHLHSVWKYPANVQLVPVGKDMDIEQQKSASYFRKILFFVNFARVLYRQCVRQRPAYLLIYDNLSLFAYHLVRPLLSFKHKVWYHSHDVLEKTTLNKVSIGALADKAESKAFKYLDIFSLPSNDRKRFFPMEQLKGEYFYIPNYPSKKFYNNFYKPQKIAGTVKIIFQGQVAPYRGIEEIIPLLSGSIQDHALELGLIGPCADDYKKTVLELAEKWGVVKKIVFKKVPYSELPELTSEYQIGLALLSNRDVMTTTIGTASNKLYEYAALGLPVIYYKSDNLIKHLGNFTWAVPSELSSEKIAEQIFYIIDRYQQMSVSAHEDFVQALNFETVFIPAKKYVRESLAKSK